MSPSIFCATKKLWSLLTTKERWQWVKISSFALLISALEIATASAVVVFAQVLNHPETGRKYIEAIGLSKILPPQYEIFYIALLVGMIYLIKNTIAIFVSFYEHNAIQKMRHRFKITLLERYAQVDYNYYLTRNASETLSIVSNDVNLSFSQGIVALTILLSEGAVLFCLLGMIICMNPSLAFIVFGVGATLYFILTRKVFPRLYLRGQAVQQATQSSNKTILQFFYAFKEIIVLGKQQYFVQAHCIHSQEDARLQARQNITNVLPRLISELLFMLFFVLAVSYLCFQGASSQTMLSILGSYLYAGFRLLPGINRMVTQLNLFKTLVPSVDRVHQEYHITTSVDASVNAPDLVFEKNISLREVSFKYLNQTEKVLRDINLVITKGECLGIVGKSGSGKSTLTDLILGLLIAQEGNILIDEKYPVHSPQWRTHIGYVQQSVYLTDDTIQANIAFGEDPDKISGERVQAAVRDAQLETLIQKLPLGINTLVGEHGVRLSGGERQRIAIARALYRNPEVLIFDEATSALDSSTEAGIMETIHSIHQKNTTVIIIAHRLSTLKHCNNIARIADGRLQMMKFHELEKA